MSDEECVHFLQWALPRARLRWDGFRRVRRQVCKRVERRRRALGLADLAAYASYLDEHTEEWAELERLCRVMISRFYRDAGVFAALGREVLPALARTRTSVAAWSIGCASGEEPYTLALLWELELRAHFPAVSFSVLATDVDAALLSRARRACYGAASLKELPATWRSRAFERRRDLFCLKPPYRKAVRFREHDVRSGSPDCRFDLILCRNLVFTYFELDLQREVLARLATCLRPAGALVVGAHEALPEHATAFAPWSGAAGVYRRHSSVTLV